MIKINEVENGYLVRTSEDNKIWVAESNDSLMSLISKLISKTPYTDEHEKKLLENQKGGFLKRIS